MRITEIQLRGNTLPWQQEGVDDILGNLSPRLNVISGPAGVGKSALARMVANLVYGRPPALPAEPIAEGALVVRGEEGEYILRRVDDGRPQGRLTIAARGGAATDSQTIRNLLGGIDPTLLARLYAIDFRCPPQIGFLVSEALAGRAAINIGDQDNSPRAARTERAADKPRQQIDDLIRRRDDVALSIEAFYAEGRSDSAELERQLQEVDQCLAERQRRAEQLKTEIADTEQRLAEVEARLRYAALATHLVDDAANSDEAIARQIDALEEAIGRSRQMIADVEPRADKVRRDLATLHSGGAAEDVAGLAEQRIALKAMEGLLDDLDAEIALLARTPETTRPTADQAHARMRPAAELLRRQIYVLCGQISTQQQAAERRFLELEAERLERVQRDLSDQLETLLRRRQALSSAQRLGVRPILADPVAPHVDQCRCSGHGEASAQASGGETRAIHDPKLVDKLQSDREVLLDQRRMQADKLAEIGRETAAAEAQWQLLQRKRGRLTDGRSVENLREELARLETQIEGCLDPLGKPSSSHGSRRASDLLAQLTNGRLVQIRTRSDVSEPTIVDRSGRVLRWSALSAAEVDQVTLAITLSVAAWHAEQGLCLPLVLDEPFLQLDAAEAAVMASVLEAFAAGGHQILVFTGDREACRRFETLGLVVRRLGLPMPAPAESRSSQTPAPAAETTRFRIVREPADMVASTNQRRVPVASSETNDVVFYLTIDDSLDRFPVLGSDTQDAFAAVSLHTVGDLLAAEPHQVASDLGNKTIKAQTVHLWQTHMLLMCSVPGVSLDDAQVLTACNVWSPDDLANSELDALVQLARDFFETDRGSRFVAVRAHFTIDGLRAWQEAALARRGQRRQTAMRRPAQSRDNSNNAKQATSSSKTETPKQTTSRAGRSERQPRTKRRAPLRFLLDAESPVVDAPSIGPKTAERLASVGIRTVADLLNSDASSTAEELNVRNISAAAIAAWQYQARLVCCIPELRGYAAQLLVACGLVEPDQVANADPEELAREVRRFSKTKEGQRILRDRPAPPEEKIARWVDYATQQRPLEAA